MPYTEPPNTTGMKRSPLGAMVRTQMGAHHRPRLRFGVIAIDCETGEERWRWRTPLNQGIYGIGFNEDYFVVRTSVYTWNTTTNKVDAENLKTTFTEAGTVNSVNCFVLDSRGMPLKQFLIEYPYIGGDYDGIAFSGDNIVIVNGKLSGTTVTYTKYEYSVDGDFLSESVVYSYGIPPNYYWQPFVSQLPDGNISICTAGKAVSPVGDLLGAGGTSMAIADGEDTVIIGYDPNNTPPVYLRRTTSGVPSGYTYIGTLAGGVWENAEQMKIRIFEDELFCRYGVYNKDDFSYVRAVPTNALIRFDMDASGNIYHGYNGSGVGSFLIKYDKDFNEIWSTSGWGLGFSFDAGFVVTNGDVVLVGA